MGKWNELNKTLKPLDNTGRLDFTDFYKAFNSKDVRAFGNNIQAMDSKSFEHLRKSLADDNVPDYIRKTVDDLRDRKIKIEDFEKTVADQADIAYCRKEW